jgi:hypothetical protein
VKLSKQQPLLLSEYFVVCILSARWIGVNFAGELCGEQDRNDNRELCARMMTIELLIGHALWVLGLSGALATLSYLSWLRGVRGWSWSYTVQIPLFLFPLSVSLFLFSGGLALTGLWAAPSAPWWQWLAWSVLAVLFGGQSVLYLRAGRRTGWEAPIEEKSNHE